MRYTMSVEPGAVVAKRFRLERQLGAGGMGSVWAATHLVTHKSVALKFLHKKHDDAEARRRVLREARAACAVQHPNVVSVHDVIEDEDGTPILVMDLLRGESLADKLARERTLAPADALATIVPVLSALAAAHAVGIVHRDLKPANVFLVDGAASNVRILDFGVAKLTGKDGATKETNRLTETGAMIGTPRYMAPEQAFGESDIDARADLWSVGAVLYECLSGVPPTDGANLGQILKVLASGTIRPLATRAPTVPAALAAVVDRLLEIDKDKRPGSAASAIEQLAPLARSADALAAPASPPPAVEAETVTSTFPGVHVTPAPSVGAARPRLGWVIGGAAVVAIAAAAGLFGGRLRAHDERASAAPVVAAAAPAPAPAPPEPTPAVAEPKPVVSAAPAASAPTAAPSASTAAVVKPVTRAPAAAPAPKPTTTTAPPGRSGGTPLIAEPTF